jgi:hypothetical protein
MNEHENENIFVRPRNLQIVPTKLWVSIIGLGGIAFLDLIRTMVATPLYLLSVALHLALLLGLYKGHRWAFIVTCLLGLVNLVGTLAMITSRHGGMMIFNGLVFFGVIVVPLLYSINFFWNDSEHTDNV